MDPKQLKRLIDERVHDHRTGRHAESPPSARSPKDMKDSAALDAHLAAHPDAASELRELERTRELLAATSADSPSHQETETMWSAIQAAAPGASAASLHVQHRFSRRTIVQFTVAAAGIAATLVIAFFLGEAEYGVPVVSQAEFSPPAERYFDVQYNQPVAHPSRPADKPEALSSLGYVAGAADEAARVHAFGADRRSKGTQTEVAGAEFRAGDVVVGRPYVATPPPVPEVLGSEVSEGVNEKFQAGLGGLGISRGAAVVEGVDVDGDGLNRTSETEVEAGVPAVSKIPALVAEAAPPSSEGRPKTDDLAAFGDAFGTFEHRATMEHSDGALEIESTAVQERVEEITPPAPPPPVRTEQKVIKNGELVVEVVSYPDAYAEVSSIAQQHGGFVADVTTKEQSGGALLGQLVIRVQPEGFEPLFAALKGIGRLESENVQATDVTAEYVDLEARIHNLQLAEERLRELMTKKSFIDKIASMLEVERELTRVRGQIEQFQGQLRVMADRVALSTIRMTLREPPRPVPSASMSVEVSALDDAAEDLGTALESLGGRLVSGNTSKRDDGTLMGNYQLQVSLASFDALLGAIQALGRLESKQVVDRRFEDAAEPWAQNVPCNVALALYERSRQLPSGQVTLEVDSLSDALSRLEAILTDHGASIVSNTTNRRDDGSSAADLSLRVPAGQFAGLNDALTSLGRTTGKAIAGEAGRIVGGAANVPATISLTLAERPRQVPSGSIIIEVGKFETARRSLSTLIDEKNVQLLASNSNQRTDGTWVGAFRLGIQAADMDTVVSWLETLGRVDSRQLQGLGLGDLSKVDPDALGVIELTLAEKAALRPPSRQAGDRLRDRLRDGLAGLYASLGLILYGLILMAPWLIVVLLLAWLITWRLRHRRLAPAFAAARGSPKPEHEPPTPRP